MCVSVHVMCVHASVCIYLCVCMCVRQASILLSLPPSPPSLSSLSHHHHHRHSHHHHRLHLPITLCHRFQRFEEALRLFESMDPTIRKDSVTYINAVRASAFCRSWEYSLGLLEEASSALGKNVLPVVTAMITNLRHIDTLSPHSVTAVGRAWDLVRWLRNKDITATSQTMVSDVTGAVNISRQGFMQSFSRYSHVIV